MFLKIPFESEIPFNTNISEITKMSLEHDFNVNDGAVLGNFYISGEYKTHEVSINTDPFNYTLPFSVELRNDIKEDSLEFNIENFTYDIINNNTLKVNIEYSLKGELKEEEKEEDNLFERVDESNLENELEQIDDLLEQNKEEIEKEDIEQEEKEEDRITENEQKTIMENIKDSEDTYVTYHIHVVKESETLESISALYNVSPSLIKEYNDNEEFMIGNKIVIPKIDE